METAYRRAAAGKRKIQRRDGNPKKDRRRLVQLLTSLALFLLVFIGRGAFSDQLDGVNEWLATDIDFKAMFQQFNEDIAGGESVLHSFGRLAAAVFGSDIPEPEDAAPGETPVAAPESIILLSETSKHGLDQLREFGVLEGIEPSDEALPPEPTVSVEPEPEIVTAVAQTHTAEGVALPSNVSFEHYELGLEETAVPVMGPVTSTFGYRTSPITGKREFHLALDIGAAEGTEIGAFADGVVRYIGENDDFGLYLMIDHANGAASFYAHCSKLLVQKGDVVTCGQTVALVGHTGSATGPHLHLTILKDDIRLDPAHYVDPS